MLSMAGVSSTTGPSVAIAGLRSGLGIWHIESGLEVLSMNEGSIVYCVAATTDGTQLLTCQEGKVLLRSSVDMRVIRSFEHAQEGSQSAAFSPNGGVIASGSRDEIIVWETQSGREIQRFSTFHQRSEFAFSPDGQLLAASVGGRRILVWNYRTGEEVYRLDNVRVSCLCFGRDSYLLATGSIDSTISLWDLRAHKSEPIRLTGNAKRPRTIYVIASDQPDDFWAKEAIHEGLIAAGHRVVTDGAIMPEAVITFDAGSPLHIRVQAILAASGAELISISVLSGAPGEFDFNDRSRWQSSFEGLLKKLDELVTPGRLLRVPELPEPYWRRKELNSLPPFWVATILGPEGSGRHTFAAAIAREPSVRRRYPGGIYWEPIVYPTAKEPVLLIFPRFQWESSYREEDSVLGPSDYRNRAFDKTLRILQLKDLDRSEQLDFLGPHRPPTAVLTPALGRLALLARWRAITAHFGAERISQWLKNKSVPDEYGTEAVLTAVHCMLDLLSYEDRTVLELLAADPEASLDDRARAENLPPGAVQHAIDTAASLNMLVAQRAGGLRPEFRRLLSDVPDGAEFSGRYLIFLAYADQDKIFARRFANLVVQEAGGIQGELQGIVDLRVILAEPNAEVVTADRLHRSDVMLLILSTAAIKSSWMDKLLSQAFADRIPIVPIKIEPCEVPSELASSPVVDLSRTGLRNVDPFDSRFSEVLKTTVEFVHGARNARLAQAKSASALHPRARQVCRISFLPAQQHLPSLQKPWAMPGCSKLCTHDREPRTKPQSSTGHYSQPNPAATKIGETGLPISSSKSSPSIQPQRPVRAEAESRPSDPLWHQAMWAAAAWLNDPAHASEDAIWKLVAANDRLLELLSVGHSNTLISRVAFYLAFTAKPSLDHSLLVVDSVSSSSPELRYGRALYPWLKAVSWIVANVASPNVLHRIELAIGLVQENLNFSSTSPASLATECQRELSEVILPWMRFSYLAESLENLFMDSPSRTHPIVEQIQELEIDLSVVDYVRLLTGPNLCRRIAAYVRLTAQPNGDPRIVPLILNTLPQKRDDTSETTLQFALYWSLSAIAAGQDPSSDVSPYRERLLTARASFATSSEGALLVDQILAGQPIATERRTHRPCLSATSRPPLLHREGRHESRRNR